MMINIMMLMVMLVMVMLMLVEVLMMMMMMMMMMMITTTTTTMMMMVVMVLVVILRISTLQPYFPYCNILAAQAPNQRPCSKRSKTPQIWYKMFQSQGLSKESGILSESWLKHAALHFIWAFSFRCQVLQEFGGKIGKVHWTRLLSYSFLIMTVAFSRSGVCFLLLLCLCRKNHKNKDQLALSLFLASWPVSRLVHLVDVSICFMEGLLLQDRPHWVVHCAVPALPLRLDVPGKRNDAKPRKLRWGLNLSMVSCVSYAQN